MYDRPGHPPAPPGAYPPHGGYPLPPGYQPRGYPPRGYTPPGYLQRPPEKNGLAIASLVLSLVGLVTCGTALVASTLGLIFGIIAFNNVKKEPLVYGGKKMAVAGIVMSGTAFILAAVVVASIAVPNLVKSRQNANAATAIHTVRAIAAAQVSYKAMHGRFADLYTLQADGLINTDVGSGMKDGYNFTSAPVPGYETVMFDTTAIPMSAGTYGTGTMSFGTNENFVIYEAQGQVELKGTPQNRQAVGGRDISRRSYSDGSP